MGELTKMPNNNVTVKLIDLMMTQSNPNDSSEFGVFIVMEYLQSDLKKLMNSVPNVEINEDHILNISYNLFCALKFMHTANVLQLIANLLQRTIVHYGELRHTTACYIVLKTSANALQHPKYASITRSGMGS